jgi:flagellar hook capping protein FlgD
MKKFLILLLLLCLFSASPAQFFEITFDDTSGHFTPPGTATLAGWLKNVSNDSLHIKMIRVENNLPSALWSTSMCMNVCFPPNVDSASTMDPGFNAIPSGDSVLVDVVIFQLDTIPAVLTMRVKYATMDDAQIHYQWFEASSLVSGIDENPNTEVSKFKLLNNYPNPFNNQTVISAQIQKPSRVKLQIYDVLGREVFNTSNEITSAGTINFRWNGVNNEGIELSSGIYFYKVTTNSNGTINQSQIKKLTLLR